MAHDRRQGFSRLELAGREFLQAVMPRRDVEKPNAARKADTGHQDKPLPLRHSKRTESQPAGPHAPRYRVPASAPEWGLPSTSPTHRKAIAMAKNPLKTTNEDQIRDGTVTGSAAKGYDQCHCDGSSYDKYGCRVDLSQLTSHTFK